MRSFRFELCESILDAPLPSFPLCYRQGSRVPVVYHFTNKLQYDPAYSVLQRPVLEQVFSRIPAVHVLRNGGDLCHTGHRESFRLVVDLYGLTRVGSVLALGNDADEVALLEAMRAGMHNPERYHTELFNANRLLDPTVFRIIGNVGRRRYPFCYTARLIREKRLELLLDGLALLKGRCTTSGMVLSSGIDEQPEYRAGLVKQLWAAGVRVRTGLSTQAVNHCLNEAAMGLALSKGEGQCMAVGEYLLTGLPVITIEGATGGRNFYLDQHNAVFCSLNADSIARAIEAVLESIPDREAIRSRFARHCLPASYWDLQALAAEAARKTSMVPGTTNQQIQDRLITYSTLRQWGISRAAVMDGCIELLGTMNCLFVQAPAAQARGLQMFVYGLRKNVGAAAGPDTSSTAIQSPGYALWEQGQAPWLSVTNLTGEAMTMPLERPGLFHYKFNGGAITLRVHAAGRP